MNNRLMRPLCHVVAVAKNQVIGIDNRLPWHIPGELKWFKQHTLGKPVIMGRKTWDSLPKKPLPERLNIILTRNQSFVAEGATIVHTLTEALEIANQYSIDNNSAEIAIIGGGDLFTQTLERCDRLYYTEIDLAPTASNPDLIAYYPKVDWRKWNLTNELQGPVHPDHGYGCYFKIYERLISH